MSPEFHARAVEIFVQAIEIDDEKERRKWLDAVCATDPALHAQVAQMLAADATQGLSEPALHVAAGLVVDDVTVASNMRNVRLGPYLVGDSIGAGGMGAVYEALDVRLNRKVAVKILPSQFVRDRERVQRFRQEARAASMLNHPNIVSIYDAAFDEAESGDSRYYIATEFVEGGTLRQMLASGPPPLERVLEISIQICSALIAAHQAGIIHRDIKPENVMVRPDGIVKVLDFGIAKLTENSGGSPLLETVAGTFAGTGSYVSPEQLNGKVATPTSDLFSTGVLLYELSTGTRPFTGATQVAIGSAILSGQPVPPSSIVPALGADFDAIVLRALEKDPELRYQTAADLRAGLRLLARGPATESASKLKHLPAKSKLPSLLLAAAGGAAVAALAVGAAWFFHPPVSTLPLRVERLTDSPGEEIYGTLTPSGREFIYSSAERGKWDIYLQRTGGKTALNLTLGSAADDREPALSRDGTHIAFRSERDGGGLFVMEATGENPVRIAARGHLPAWSPDGKSIAYSDDTFITPNIRSAPTSKLHIIDLASGAERTLATADAIQPNWSPDGQRIAYWQINSGGQRDLETISVAADAHPVPVTNDPFLDWNPVWSPTGEYLYFISDRGGAMNVWRVPIDQRSGKTSGPPEAVTVPAAYVKSLSFSADGSRFLYSSAAARVNLYSVDFDPSRFEVTGKPVLSDGAHNITNFSISPDESSIVYDTLADTTEEIWIQRLDGSSRRRLISDEFRNRMPRWSPSGHEIVFFSNRGGSGVFNDWLMSPDGSGLRPLTAVKPGSGGVVSTVWLDDKRLIAARQTGDLSLLDSDETAVSNPSTVPGGSGIGTVTLSDKPRDGTILGYGYTHGIEEELTAFTYPPGKFEKIGRSGRAPEWLPGSKPRFIFIRDSACYLYDWETHAEKLLFSVAPNRLYVVRASSDAKRIWFTQTIREADIWMANIK
ncbi:MAG TPA: protein kinase [Bryobacteraceae bacterium]|jgi:serine/threonine protein kinase